MPFCDCGRRFSDLGALQQNQISKAHCYCRECDRFFIHADAVEQHRSAFRSFTCFDCDRTFVRREALQQHQKSTKHCYCCECDRFFVNSEALGQHLRSPIHAMQFHCCDCDRDFVDEQALHQHLEDKIHEPSTKAKVSSFRISNWVCEQCERGLETRRRWSNIVCLSSTTHSATSNASGINGARSNLLLLRHDFTILKAEHALRE